MEIVESTLHLGYLVWEITLTHTGYVIVGKSFEIYIPIPWVQAVTSSGLVNSMWKGNIKEMAYNFPVFFQSDCCCSSAWASIDLWSIDL